MQRVKQEEYEDPEAFMERVAFDNFPSRKPRKIFR
jgi:hypothetical protein